MSEAQKKFVEQQLKIATDALMQLHFPPEELGVLGLEHWAYTVQYQLVSEAEEELGLDIGTLEV